MIYTRTNNIYSIKNIKETYNTQQNQKLCRNSLALISGISGDLLNLFPSCVNNLYEKVVFNGEESS